MNDIIEQTKQSISVSIAAISDAKNKRSMLKSKADKDYYNETALHKENLRKITKEYEDIAAQLAEKQNIAPYSRSGNHLSHDEARVSHEGIHLSWEEIFEAETKQLDNEY